MKGVLLAGGRGTRLQPLTDHIPKPLIPIAGKPTIGYLVDSMVRAGADDIIITTGYRADDLISRLGGGDRFGARFVYGIEEVPAGTAGAVRRMEGFIDDTCVIANGDLMLDVDIASMVEFHKRSGAAVTIALHRVEDPSPFGVVQLGGEGRIVRFQEKPKREEAFSNLINAGIYILEPEVLEHIPVDEKFDFARNLFPALLDKGVPLYGMELSGDWLDIGRPSDLLMASRRMVEKYGVSRNGGTVLSSGDMPGNVSGVAYVGSDVMVDPAAKVCDSSLYDDCVVSRGATILGSIVFHGASVGEDAVVEDSIICPGAAVEPGAVVRGRVVG